jgi:hypothetical protein
VGISRGEALASKEGGGEVLGGEWKWAVGRVEHTGLRSK